MTLDESVKGMLDAREQLQSKLGVASQEFMSEQMDRLAQYTAAVETHLADLEHEYENKRFSRYLELAKTQSSTKAENDSKAETAPLSADIKKLTRLVNSSWKIVSEKQSRWNHLESEYKKEGRIT